MKRPGKHNREKKILFGLIDLYTQQGQPIGSNTLQQTAFPTLSSATIRNYFATLEKEGFLTQPHTSGGRIPTEKGYRLYIDDLLSQNIPPPPFWETESSYKGKEIPRFLQESAEKLSTRTQCAVFLSAPRFDHDFITSLKLVPIDTARCLVVLVTDFGVIQTELLPTARKINTFSIKRMESYFHWRLTGTPPPESLTKEEEQAAQAIYNEMLTRYIVSYSHFIEEEVFRTGMSRLLVYPELQDPVSLANALSLFENTRAMRLLLREALAKKDLHVWFAEELHFHAKHCLECAVITIPYSIHQNAVGTIALLAPIRIPYKEIIPLAKGFGKAISHALTQSIYKFKIGHRQPRTGEVYLQKEEHQLIGQSRLLLIEQKMTQKKVQP